MGLITRCPVWLTAAAVLLAAGCVEVIEFSEGTDASYLFVDGEVRVGRAVQTVRVGRTTGAGSDGSEVIEGAAVRLTNTTTGQSVNCSDDSRGGYTCALTGNYDQVYRLEIDVPDLGTYAATTGPLAAAELNLAAEPGLEIVRRPDGSPVATGTAIVDLRYDVPEGAAGVLLIRSGLSWSYTDRSIGGMDPPRTCYFDDGIGGAYTIVDLAEQAVGERGVVRGARRPLDFRNAGASVMSLEVTRVPVEAQSYYRDLTVALDLSGSIFSERPYTTSGNVIGPAAAPRMLGYFAVGEQELLRAPLNSTEIREKTPRPLCVSPEVATPPGIDCVECLNTSRELIGPPSTVRPPWWP